MAEDDQSQEKTEQPSAKRINESREKGQVARSKDLNAFLVLLLSGVGFWIYGPYLAKDLGMIMRNAFQFDIFLQKTPQSSLYTLLYLVKEGIYALIPVLLIIALISLLAPLLMGGWVFSSKALQVQMSRLSPLKGFKRMFSLKSLVEMLKSFAKFILIAVVATLVLYWQLPYLLALAEQSLSSAIGRSLLLLIQAYIIVSASLIIIAAIDVPFQWYEHQKQLRMSKQDLKDEYKETEGKPELKSQIRRRQKEISQRRMMQEVPKATVVLTNPNHYAVAIVYQENGNRAPYVLAKGKDIIALQIARIAREHQIPVLLLPPLTRAIYFSCDVKAEIPRELYVAVAQVLAYIFQLREKTDYEAQPEKLLDLPVPEGMAKEPGERNEWTR